MLARPHACLCEQRTPPQQPDIRRGPGARISSFAYTFILLRCYVGRLDRTARREAKVARLVHRSRKFWRRGLRTEQSGGNRVLPMCAPHCAAIPFTPCTRQIGVPARFRTSLVPDMPDIRAYWGTHGQTSTFASPYVCRQIWRHSECDGPCDWHFFTHQGNAVTLLAFAS